MDNSFMERRRAQLDAEAESEIPLVSDEDYAATERVADMVKAEVLKRLRERKGYMITVQTASEDTRDVLVLPDKNELQ